MNARLKTIYFEFQESRQEDEGSSYRIEELDRFRDLSEEVATRTNMRYQILQIEHEEQMVYAQNIVQNLGSQASATEETIFKKKERGSQSTDAGDRKLQLPGEHGPA